MHNTHEIRFTISVLGEHSTKVRLKSNLLSFSSSVLCFSVVRILRTIMKRKYAY